MVSTPRAMATLIGGVLLAAAGAFAPLSVEAAVTPPASSSGSYLSSSNQDPGDAGPAAADNFVFTGAATYSIPIAVPPGRLGVSPKLSLQYNSLKTDEGIVGVGWDLPLDAIQRSTKGGMKYTACDVGCDVVYSSGGASIELAHISGNEYRAKIDGGQFVRFYYYKSTDSWSAFDKNGEKYLFGQVSGSRQDNPSTSTQVAKWCLDRVEDSNGNYLTLSYFKDSGQIYPAEVQYSGNANSRLGGPLIPTNRIEFVSTLVQNAYQTTTYPSPGFAVTNRFRIAEVKAFVGAVPTANPLAQGDSAGVLAWKYKLEYSPSSFTGRTLLAKVRRYGELGVKELPSIDMAWSPGQGGALEQTDYSYLDQTWGSGNLLGSNPLVTGDFNGDGRADLARAASSGTSWDMYLGSDTGFASKNWSTSPYPSFDGTKYVTGDFNGDGRTEIAYSKPGWTYWRVLTWNGASPGAFSVAEWSTAYSGCLCADSACTDLFCQAVVADDKSEIVLTGDFNGDGKAEIAHARDLWDGWLVSSANSTGSGFDTKYWRVTAGRHAVDNIAGGNEVVLVGDFNGDGKTDIAHTQLGDCTRGIMGLGYWLVHISNGVDGFDTQEWVGFRDGEVCAQANYSYSDGSFFVVAGDFNGDGKTDIAYHVMGHLNNFGVAGFLISRSTGANFVYPFYYTSFSEHYNPDGPLSCDASGACWSCSNWIGYGRACSFSSYPRQVVLTGDFNGDGATDIALGPVNDATAHRVSNAWLVYYGGSSSRLGYLGPTGVTSAVPGDFTGSGRSDIAFATTGGWNVLRDTGTRPDLLASISNGMGGSTVFAYDSSSRYPNTRLPISMPVVSSETVKDGFGNDSITTFTYEGGYFDLAGKEFRGFRSVKTKMPDGTSVQTWFHQKDDGATTCTTATPPCPSSGAWTQAEDADFKGKPRRSEVRDAAGSLLSATDFLWGRYPATRQYPVFVKLAERTVTDTVGGAAAAWAKTAYTYNDANGNVATVESSGTDGERITTTNLYQDYGTWPASIWRRTKTTVTADVWAQGAVTGRGTVREATYDYEATTGNLLWQEPWLSGTTTNPRTSYEYYPEGTLKKVTDPKSNVIQMDYEPTRTFPDLVVYPQTGNTIHQVFYSYDYVHGTVDNSWDENGNKTHVTFDDFGRELEITTYDLEGPTIVAKTKLEYYDSAVAGTPSYVKTSRLEALTSGETYLLVGYQYLDGLGRPIQFVTPSATWATDGKTAVTRASYDAMGRPQLVQGPFFGSGLSYPQALPTQYPSAQIAYDALGRLATVVRSDGQLANVTTRIDYVGLTATVTDGDLKKTAQKRDYLGRIIQVLEYADAGAIYTTTYKYDAAGQLRRLEAQRRANEAQGPYTWIDYDTLGRKTMIRDPDTGIWKYTSYDANGNLVTQVDAKAQTVTFTYDELNRIRTRAYSSGDATITYDYDDPVVSNGKGLLTGVWSGGMEVVDKINRYDALGRPRSVTRNIGGNATSFTTDTDFDLAGRLTGLTYPAYPDAFKVTYLYHPGTGLLQAANGSDGVLYAVFSEYDPAAQAGLLTFGNAVTTRYTHDPLSTKLTKIVTTTPAQGDLLSMELGTSGAGDVASAKGSQFGLASNPFDRSYAYDTLHRLKSEKLAKAMSLATADIAYEPHPTIAHAFLSVTRGSRYPFGYDANGNTKSGYDLSDPAVVGIRQFTSYNADNMPTRVDYTRSGLTQTGFYLYDAEGSRTRKIVGVNTTYYIGAHLEVVNNEAVRYVFAGGLRIAKKSSTGTYYFHKDHLGSTIGLTGGNASDMGKVAWTGSYTPFGALREESGTRKTAYLFTDQEYDSETGLYYFGARYYDPVLGRFLTPDSVVPRPYDPQSLNRYAYVRNNPLSRVDPTGHNEVCVGLGTWDCTPSGPGSGPPDGYPYDVPLSNPDWTPPPSLLGGQSGAPVVPGPPPRPPLTPQPTHPPPVIAQTPAGSPVNQLPMWNSVSVGSGRPTLSQLLDSSLDALSILATFFTGIGSHNRQFGPDTGAVAALRANPGYQSALDWYISGTVAHQGGAFRYAEIACSGGTQPFANPLAFVVGTTTVQFFPDPFNNGVINVVLTNDTSLTSLGHGFGFHAPNEWPSWGPAWRYLALPLSTVSQTYQWTENVR